jgi:glycosyltransferase involved in cell wall biosynthesis
MNGQLRGRSPAAGRVVPDAIAALRTLDGLGHARQVLLAYHPVARLNPYQALLYGQAWRHGVAPVPLFNFDELEAVHAVARAAGQPLVLHLHWTSGVLKAAETDEQARAAADAFLAQLDSFRAAGGQILWTAHNVLPHDTQRPELEAELQQGIVDRATAVHVLTERTAEAAAEWFSIPPDRILHIPHQSYDGAYLDAVSREQARWELGIGPEEVVYALVGAIKPYKGTERLLDAFDALLDRVPGQRRLIVAGKPDADPPTEALLARCELHPFVLLHARTIPAEEMQLFLRAADIAVLPYRRSLNSGVLLLALTFGLPVVAPSIGGIPEVVGPDVARLFDPESDEGLLRALAEADELLTPEARSAARRTAERYDPARLSAEFARAVAERVHAVDLQPA